MRIHAVFLWLAACLLVVHISRPHVCACAARAPQQGMPQRRLRVGTVRVGHYLQVHVADALQRGCGVDVSEKEQPWLGWGLGLG